jgi:hypothetical protein
VVLFAELYEALLVVLLVEQDEVLSEVSSEALPVEPYVVLSAEPYEELLEVPDAVLLVVLCEVLPVVPYVGLFAELYEALLEVPDAVQPVVLCEVLPEVPYAGLFAGLSVELLEEPCVVLGTVLDPMQILQMLKTVSKPLTDQSFSFLSPNNICLSFILTNLKQIVKVFLDLFFSFKMTSLGRSIHSYDSKNNKLNLPSLYSQSQIGHNLYRGSH